MSGARGLLQVVSALRVRGRNPAVERWASAVPVAVQFVSAVTVAELERGVVARERSEPAQDFQPLGVTCLNPWDTDPFV